MATSGSLYLVSTPIGNPDDLTMRARRILQEADLVVCEEERVGSTLLSRLGIRLPLVELNEHSEEEQVSALVARLVQGQILALVSDHGTPLIEDPGAMLVQAAQLAGFRVVPVPGASAVTAALVISGFDVRRFRFIGKLPQKEAQRRSALETVRRLPETLLFLEAPYRLLPLLNSLEQALGPDRKACVACNLTTPEERVVRGELRKVYKWFVKEPFKGEFVVVMEGSPRNPS